MSPKPAIFFGGLFLILAISFSSWGLEAKPTEEMEWESSFLTQTVLVEEVKIHFVELGKGPPVLFLHGLGGSWKDFVSNLAALTPLYRVIAIDFPGFGDSDKPEVDYSIEWLTTMVEKFLREKKLDGVVGVGHSMGGLVALNLAARPNSPISRLVVIDAVGIGDKADFLSYAMTRKLIRPNSRWDFIEGTVRGGLKAMVESFVKGRDGKTSKEFFQSVPKNPFTSEPFLPMTPAVQMSASIMDFDIRPHLSKIRQPTLILWGSQDPVAPAQDASALQGQISQAKMILFDGIGHAPMQEVPDRFNQEVWKFLQATESGSSR
jgi:pimeloyl-ACP methyl ester carboxylesterase